MCKGNIKILTSVLFNLKLWKYHKVVTTLSQIMHTKSKEHEKIVLQVANSTEVLTSNNTREILKAIATAQDVDVAKIIAAWMLELPDLAYDEKLPEVLKIMVEPSCEVDEDFAAACIGCLLFTKFLDREDAIEILKEIGVRTNRENLITNRIIFSFLTQHSLGKRDLNVVTMIINYSSVSKLKSIEKYMFGHYPECVGLLENPETSEISLKTIEHFKDYPEDGTGLFSCVTLFDVNSETSKKTKSKLKILI